MQDKDPEKIQKACKNLGAEFTETKADLCAVFPVLPRYPVTLKIWFAAKFLQLLPHLLHSDNDRHDPEEIFCQIQEILHLQTISLKLPDILAELEKQHTDPPLINLSITV